MGSSVLGVAALLLAESVNFSGPPKSRFAFSFGLIFLHSAAQQLPSGQDTKVRA
jgi:hypothetical protein